MAERVQFIVAELGADVDPTRTRERQRRSSCCQVLPIIREIQRAGAMSLWAIAEAMNERGVATARGGKWQAMTVSNLLARSG
jgi:hypothetical protein